MFIMPASADEIDYSCYQAQWAWDINEVRNIKILDITRCNNSEVTFKFIEEIGDVRTETEVHNEVPIVDGVAIFYYDDYGKKYNQYTDPYFYTINAPGYIKLTFGSTGIWVEVYDSTRAFAGMFTIAGFELRTIQYPGIKVNVNGTELQFDQEPAMCGNRVMVPMRKIFEALNADVYWDAQRLQSKKVWSITAIKNDTKIIIGERGLEDTGAMMIKGPVDANSNSDKMELLPLYATPVILNGRTLISVRAVAEALDADVQWDGNTNTVIITGDASGTRKSDEKIKEMENFDVDKALEYAGDGAGYYGGLPEYDSNGKYFFIEIPLSNYDFMDAKVYHDGSIKREN